MAEKKEEKSGEMKSKSKKPQTESKSTKKKSIFKEKKFLLLMLAIFLLIIAASGAYYWNRTRFDPEKYNEQISLAESAYEEKRYGEALEGYLLATEIAPNQAEGFVGVVKILTEKRRMDDVGKILSEAESSISEGDLAALHLIVANQYAEMGMYQEAYETYESSYSLNNSEEASEGALMSAMVLGNVDEANKYSDMRVDLSVTEVDKAWERFEEVRDEEEDLHTVVITAKDLINDGYASLAKKLLEPSLDDMTEYWEGRYFLGRAYFDLGELEKAEEEFNTAVSLGSDDYALYFYLARLNVLKDDKNKAYKFYDRAVEFVDDEKAKVVVLEYADLLIDDKQYVRVDELLTQFENEIWAQIALMKYYSVQTDYESMLEAAEKYIVSEEVDSSLVSQYYSLMLDHYLDSEDMESATALLADLEMLDGQESLYLYYKGKEAVVSGDLTEAESYFMMSMDADLDGFISELAEKELSNI